MALDAEQQKALQGAKLLEKHQRFDAAIQLLDNAGLHDEVARILSGQRRFSEAAQVLVKSLGVTPAEAASLSADKRRSALNAAIMFSRAGQNAEAVDWFVALREHPRAAEILEKAGDSVGAARILAAGGKRLGLSSDPRANAQGVSGSAVTYDSAQRLEGAGKLDIAVGLYVQLKRYADAGRVARALGKLGDAGSFYAEAGSVYEAGLCYVEAGDSGKAIENLIRVSRTDTHYRLAAKEVVRLAAQLSHVSLKMDHFMKEFIAPGPQSLEEFESFYMLSKIYEQHDLLENAKEALRKVVEKNASYRDCKTRLARLELETAVSSKEYERVLRDDPSLRDQDKQRPRFADFPELPPLPGLPALPQPVLTSAGAPMTLGREVGEDVERIAREVADVPTGGTLFSIGKRPAAVASPAMASAPPPVAPAPLDFQVGSVLQDRYRLEEKIGEGGTAAVFRVYDLELSEEIALKVFFQAQLDEQALGRFRQELALSRQLVHPNIVRLFDIGSYRGCRFITMELLVGSDLSQYLAKGPVALKTGLNILMQVCAGLKAAHDRGIVHRDIKPENIFLTRAGQVKVMDFGIAKRQLTKGVTVAGMVAGTPEYMSPEQINSFTTVTHSTDLYSLGIVAYQIFTGQLPFRSPELVPLLMMQAGQSPPNPRSINPAIPEALEVIILKLLHKQPEGRYADCSTLSDALGVVAAGLKGN